MLKSFATPQNPGIDTSDYMENATKSNVFTYLHVFFTSGKFLYKKSPPMGEEWKYSRIFFKMQKI